MNSEDSKLEQPQIVRAILENTLAVIYAKDRQGRYQLANRRFEELFDVTADELRGRTDYDIFPPDLAALFHRNDEQVAVRNESIEFEEIAPHADGPHTYISLKFPYRDAEGNCVGVCGISTDITPRKRVEAALEQSEQRFRQLADNIPECFWVKEIATWRVLYVSPAFERIWQRPCQDILDDPYAWIYAIHPADRHRIETAFFTKAVAGEYHEEYRIVRPDGSLRWIADRGFPVRDESGEVYRVAGIAEDITQRRQLEQEVVEIGSHERQRISRDLHDTLGQQLTGLGYLTQSLTNRLENADDKETAKLILDGIQEAISEVRRVVRGVAPVNVDTLGLRAALQQFVDTICSYYDIQCVFLCRQPVAMDDNMVATQLFRIAQEATHNAVKHSGATTITVSLIREHGRLTLQVRDNGKGSTALENSQGMGMRIMRYRSNIIGAEFTVDSTPDGMTVTCALREASSD